MMTHRCISNRTRVAIAAGVFPVTLVASPSGAQAFDGLMSLCLAGLQRVTPDNLWSAWSLAPEVLVPLAVLLTAFLYGCRHAPDSPTRPAAFLAGWALLVIAIVSPLCRLSATLVSAHMVQHMLLITAVPILLAFARPGPSLRASVARITGSLGWLPSVRALGVKGLTVAFGAAIWLWHAPAIYTLLLTNAVYHVLGMAALIVLATFFWNAILVAGPRRAPAAIVALLATMAHTGLLGALLTFGSRPFYPIVATGALDWGLTPLGDQQIAGLIMWVPGGIVFMAAALALCAVWLRRLGRANSARRSLEGRSA
jgi:putative membrane protein